MSVMTLLAWCELPGRTTVPEIRSPSIPDAAQIEGGNEELVKLNAMAARSDKRNSAIKVSGSDWIPPSSDFFAHFANPVVFGV